MLQRESEQRQKHYERQQSVYREAGKLLHAARQVLRVKGDALAFRQGKLAIDLLLQLDQLQPDATLHAVAIAYPEEKNQERQRRDEPEIRWQRLGVNRQSCSCS